MLTGGGYLPGHSMSLSADDAGAYRHMRPLREPGAAVAG
jgi:hypothetical protein